MELVAGGRLDQDLAKGEPLPIVRALEVGLDVSEGLRAAHEVGLVHGDIKPANILFDASGTAKVVDFGLAQFVNRQQERGEIWGTPFYIAPERARGGLADHRADVYSLGATLFHALTGKPPFDGETAADVVVARLKAEAPRLETVRPEVNARTSAVIARMLAMDPHVRYPTSASLRADLCEALEEAKALHHGRDDKSAAGAKKRKLIAVAAVGAIALAGLGAWLAMPKPEAHPVVAPPPPPVVTTEVQAVESGPTSQWFGITFFNEANDARIAEAAAALTGPKPLDMYDPLEKLYENAPPSAPRSMWLRVLQTVPCYAAGRDKDVDFLLSQVLEIKVDQPTNHPSHMPQWVARLLKGEAASVQIHAARGEWPSWYGDVVTFYDGLRQTGQGNFDGGASLLALYAAAPAKGPRWPYAFQPLARTWVDGIAAWKGAEPGAKALADAGKVKEAVDAYTAASTNLPAFARKHVETEIAKLKKKIGDEVAKKDREEKKKAKAVADKEVAAVRAALKDQEEAIRKRKDFAAAVKAIAAVEATLTTQPARDELKPGKDRITRMARIQEIIIQNMASDPFKAQGHDLGGDGVGAGPDGIRVSTRGGVVLKPWADVSDRTMLRIGAYYADDPKTNNAEKAQRYLALALYSSVIGNDQATPKFAEQAIKLDPSVQETVKKLLPKVSLGGGP